MSNFITSADAIFTLTVSSFFSAPITLENWSSDRAWEAAALEMAETQMSVDGKLNAGWVPRPIEQTVSFSAASSSLQYIEDLMLAQQTTRSLYSLGAVITLPATSRKYTLSNGFLVNGSVLPAAGTVLEARPFTFRWGAYTAAAA